MHHRALPTMVGVYTCNTLVGSHRMIPMVQASRVAVATCAPTAAVRNIHQTTAAAGDAVTAVRTTIVSSIVGSHGLLIDRAD